MKNLYPKATFLVIFCLLSVANVFAQTPNVTPVEHEGKKTSVLPSGNGTWTINCNTLFEEVCYTTETFDLRCQTSINIKTYNGLISPPMAIDLKTDSPLTVLSVNATAKYTYCDPANPMMITHLYVFE